MLSFILSNWRLIAIGLLTIALAVQTGRISLIESEFEAYRVKIQRQVAENQAKAALERARMAQNAQEALDALQVRLDRLNRSYRVLRDRRGSQPVPSLSEATGVSKSCPGEPSKPNPAVEQVERLERGIEALLEFGDGEIAKLVELYRLNQWNASGPSSP